MIGKLGVRFCKSLLEFDFDKDQSWFAGRMTDCYDNRKPPTSTIHCLVKMWKKNFHSQSLTFFSFFLRSDERKNWKPGVAKSPEKVKAITQRFDRKRQVTMLPFSSRLRFLFFHDWKPLHNFGNKVLLLFLLTSMFLFTKFKTLVQN